MGRINYSCRGLQQLSKKLLKLIVAYAILVMDDSHWELFPQNINHKEKILRALDNHQRTY